MGVLWTIEKIFCTEYMKADFYQTAPTKRHQIDPYSRTKVLRYDIERVALSKPAAVRGSLIYSHDHCATNYSQRNILKLTKK